MARPSSEHPTTLELQILKVLWDQAPLPVSEVRQRLSEVAGRDLTHSSVITVLNIMVRKRYLSRKKQGKAFLYSPRVDEAQVGRGMLSDLMERMFDGSVSSVMLRLLEVAEIDDDELRELKRLIQNKAREMPA